MALTIPDNIQGIMGDLNGGTAFDTSMVTNLGTTSTNIGSIVEQKDSYTAVMGEFSPAMQNFSGLSASIDTTPATLDSLSGAVDGTGTPLTDAAKQSLVGLPSGSVAAFQSHATTQFSSLTDNMSIYASSQSVNNALGSSTGCNSLSDHFGSITSTGQAQATSLSTAATSLPTSLTAATQLQTAHLAELTAADTQIVSMLTGKITPATLAKVVTGTGLADQIGGIFSADGKDPAGADAQSVQSAATALNTPNLTSVYAAKSQISDAVSTITSAAPAIQGMVSGELNTQTQALTTLQTLGSANAVASLFSSNECIQTLLGFVGTDSFLGKLSTS